MWSGCVVGAGQTREKLTTNVGFPLKGLKVASYASEEAQAAASSPGATQGAPEYDLYAVINHFGTLTGGHYTATCRMPGQPTPNLSRLVRSLASPLFFLFFPGSRSFSLGTR